MWHRRCVVSVDFGMEYYDYKKINSTLENERTIASVRLLKRLKPTSITKERVQTVLLLLLAINPKFDYQYMVKWLKRTIGEHEARIMLKTILTTHRGPFSFVLDSALGWMIVIIEENNNTNSNNSAEEIMKVPFISSPPPSSSSSSSQRTSSPSLTLINTDIRIGDEINLMISPKSWFIVHEIRPQTNSVLLIASTESKKCRLKGREYKEVYCLSLIGCTVKRRCTLQCELHYPRSCFCQSSKTDIPILFQFPKPDPDAALETLATMVENEGQTFDLIGNEIDEFGSDHVIKMQRASFVQMWLEKKQNIIAAKKYLDKVNSTLSLSRIHWLAVGRSLRVVSLGGRDLLETWKKWSKSCPSFGESDQSLSSIWMQFRPSTNCDHPDVIRAREFLQERKQALIEKYQSNSPFQDQQVAVNLYSDPLARAILDDANTALKDVVLEYWAENFSHQSLQVQTNSSSLPPPPVNIPCAMYITSPLVSQSTAKDGSNKSPLGHFEEMDSCDATIASGNLISITENGYDYPHICQFARQWYYVHRVDLLFSRILVSKCSAPPLPWMGSIEDHLFESRHWIEICKLWNVLVCSLIEGKLPNNKLRYRIFLSPTPDPIAATKLLKRLSERSPSYELGTAHATHLSQQSRVSSQIKGSYERTSLVDLDILERTSSTLTLCWCCSGDTDYFITNELTPALREDIGPVQISIRKSIDQMVFPWQVVYQGDGRGCTIENLDSNTAYHIRLLPLQSSLSSSSSSSQFYQKSIRGSVYISARTEEREEG